MCFAMFPWDRVNKERCRETALALGFRMLRLQLRKKLLAGARRYLRQRTERGGQISAAAERTSSTPCRRTRNGFKPLFQSLSSTLFIHAA